jgi:hypothetical protein
MNCLKKLSGFGYKCIFRVTLKTENTKTVLPHASTKTIIRQE